MIWLWVLTVVLLALAVVALITYQRATDLSGRIAAGVGAMVLGVLGLVMLAALVFGNLSRTARTGPAVAMARV